MIANNCGNVYLYSQISNILMKILMVTQQRFIQNEGRYEYYEGTVV